MVLLRRAKRKDIPGINTLLGSYGLRTIDKSYVNHRDICEVADQDGQIVAVIWVGLMRQDKQGYVDYFTVNPEYSKKGLGAGLARHTFEILKRRGVEHVFGVIGHTPHHDSSAMNALKMAMGAHQYPYTLVEGQVRYMESELKQLEVS